MKSITILHFGDPVVGIHKFPNEGLVVYMPYDDEEPTLDGLGYGEKRTLMAFYSLDNEKLNRLSFYKINDLWQCYFPFDGKRELGSVSTSLYELCSSAVLTLEDDDSTVKFVNHIKACINEEEVDAFIDELKEKFKNTDAKLVLVPSKNKKDID